MQGVKYPADDQLISKPLQRAGTLGGRGDSTETWTQKGYWEKTPKLTLMTLSCSGQQVATWYCTASLWILRKIPHLQNATSNHITSHTGKLRLRNGPRSLSNQDENVSPPKTHPPQTQHFPTIQSPHRYPQGWTASLSPHILISTPQKLDFLS